MRYHNVGGNGPDYSHIDIIVTDNRLSLQLSDQYDGEIELADLDALELAQRLERPKHTGEREEFVIEDESGVSMWCLSRLSIQGLRVTFRPWGDDGEPSMVLFGDSLRRFLSELGLSDDPHNHR